MSSFPKALFKTGIVNHLKVARKMDYKIAPKIVKRQWFSWAHPLCYLIKVLLNSHIWIFGCLMRLLPGLSFHLSILCDALKCGQMEVYNPERRKTICQL